MENTQETKLCKHCQTEIPKKAKICPNCRKKQGGIGKWIAIAVGVVLVLSLFGGGSGDTTQELLPKEERVHISASEVDKAYGSPDSYKGQYVKLYGKVFGEPEKQEDAVYFQMYADAENYEKNTIVCLYGVADIASDDYVVVDGMIVGAYEYQNMMGGTISALQVVTDSVEESNYIDCCSPTIKTVDVNKTIDQKGYVVTLEKVEFSETETRVYFTINNNGTDNFSLYEFNMKIVQNGTQYENTYNYSADYPELQSDLMPGTNTSGIALFPAMDPNIGAKIYCDPSCSNWRTNLDDYVFEF